MSHVTNTAAVESQGIGAIPANPRADNPRTKAIFVYQLEPGKTLRDAIRIINNTSATKKIVIYPVDSETSSGGAFACAQAVDAKKGVGSWITLASSRVTLEPFTSQTVPFTLTTPLDAEPGEHDGCFAIQEDKPTATQAAKGITLSFRSALRVAVTIPGKLVTKISLLSVTQKDGTDASYVITPKYKNEGNVSVDTDIKVRYKTLWGSTSTTVGGQFPILPKTVSSFNFEVQRPFWGGVYHREVSTSYKRLSADAASKQPRLVLPNQSSWLVAAPRPAGAIIEILALILVVGSVLLYRYRRAAYRLVRENTKAYTVKKSDSIQSLAEKHHVSWKHLAKLNHLKAPYALKAGEKIQVPTAAKSTDEET